MMNNNAKTRQHLTLEATPFAEVDRYLSASTPEQAQFREELVCEARALLEDPGWSDEKQWHNDAVTTKRLIRTEALTGKPVTWFARETISGQGCPDYPINVFWNVLGEDHTAKESQYDQTMKEFHCLTSSNEAWDGLYLKQYSTPFPAKDRSFLCCVLVVDTTAKKPPGPTPAISRSNGQERTPQSFLIITFPVETQPADPCHDTVLKLDKGHVRGRYTSVEEVAQISTGNGRTVTRWTCASRSDAGGNIPAKVTEAAMPSSMAASVPTFFNWLKTRTNA